MTAPSIEYPLFSLRSLFFARLICYTAGCFASGLAGCLAFAAAAVLYALVQIAGRDGFDSAHGYIPPIDS